MVILFFFLIGFHSMQGWTATTKHGVKEKEEKDGKHIGKLFRKSPKEEGVLTLDLKPFRSLAK